MVAIRVGALNISANPHPTGIYVRLLSAAAGARVNFRGSDWAKITKPTSDKANQGIYVGRILVWTEIDTKAPWLDVETDDTLSDTEKSKIRIPDRAKPNFKVFNYVFVDRSHRLYVELKNEFGENFGITTARRVFHGLLVDLAHADKIDLDVTPVPRAGAVQRVLALPGLRHLHIRVIVPNADTTDEEKRKRVLKRLTDASAKQLDEIYIKKAGEDHLVATSEIRETAEIAAENGFVTGVVVGMGNESTPQPPSSRGSRRFPQISGAKAFFRALWAPSVSSDLAGQRDVAAYWAAYGGLRALWKSPYLWVAVTGTIILRPLWCDSRWANIAQDILPALLGFSVGSVAIILAAPAMKTFEFLSENGHVESYFMDLAARLIHFILAQVLGLIALLTALAYPNRYTNFAGFLIMSYAILSALSAALAIFGIARLLNAAAKSGPREGVSPPD